jgi:hypothetical protein
MARKYQQLKDLAILSFWLSKNNNLQGLIERKAIFIQITCILFTGSNFLLSILVLKIFKLCSTHQVNFQCGAPGARALRLATLVSKRDPVSETAKAEKTKSKDNFAWTSDAFQVFSQSLPYKNCAGMKV